MAELTEDQRAEIKSILEEVVKVLNYIEEILADEDTEDDEHIGLIDVGSTETSFIVTCQMCPYSKTYDYDPEEETLQEFDARVDSDFSEHTTLKV